MILTPQLLATCIFMAAQTYQVPPDVLLSIMHVEGGKVGQQVKNTNGSYDLGPMQINTLWLPELAEYWRVPRKTAWQWVRDDGCINVGVGAWILRQKIDSAGSVNLGIAHYHSRTPHLGSKYKAKVMGALKKFQGVQPPQLSITREAKQNVDTRVGVKAVETVQSLGGIPKEALSPTGQVQSSGAKVVHVRPDTAAGAEANVLAKIAPASGAQPAVRPQPQQQAKPQVTTSPSKSAQKSNFVRVHKPSLATTTQAVPTAKPDNKTGSHLKVAETAVPTAKPRVSQSPQATVATISAPEVKPTAEVKSRRAFPHEMADARESFVAPDGSELLGTGDRQLRAVTVAADPG